MSKALRSSITIGITGTPGTGKRSVAQELAKISELELISINDFAINHKFGVMRKGEFIVDLRRTRTAMKTKGKIVCGHLLPYVLPRSKVNWVVVLRCSPKELKRRYLERGYSSSKIIENLEAEMIGLLSAKSMVVYGKEKLMEFDTTKNRDPRRIAKKIFETIKGKRVPSFGKIDWLSSRQSPRALIESFHSRKPVQNHKG